MNIYNLPVWKATYKNPLCKPLLVNASTESDAKKMAIAQHRMNNGTQIDVNARGLVDRQKFEDLFEKVEAV